MYMYMLVSMPIHTNLHISKHIHMGNFIQVCNSVLSTLFLNM